MNYLSEKALAISPYVPGEQPKDKKYIKINTNENPYPPSPAVEKYLRELNAAELRLYPDPDSGKLRELIAAREGLKPEQVFCSNGSDEALAFCFAAFFSPGRTVLFPDITYSFYPVYSELFSLDYKTVPLDSSFRIRPEDYDIENGGIIFANPNAPTGIFLALSEVERIIAANLNRGVVIVDEAYIDFGGESAAALINKYPNLVVVRTFSKSHSLAGLRVGYALGDEKLIDGLNRIKNSFNSYPLDRIASACAAEALADESYFEQWKRRVIATREHITEELEKLDFEVLPSAANFIFAAHKSIPAEALFKSLKDEGILVRYFNKPRIEKYLRISIGTEEEMEEFIRVLCYNAGQIQHPRL